MKKLVFEYLVEKNLIKDMEGGHAKNSIKVCNNNEVVLSGNRLGLIELADYILNVALSDLEGYHIHLDESNFFDETNLELIILKQDDITHSIN